MREKSYSARRIKHITLQFEKGNAGVIMWEEQCGSYVEAIVQEEWCENCSAEEWREIITRKKLHERRSYVRRVAWKITTWKERQQERSGNTQRVVMWEEWQPVRSNSVKRSKARKVVGEEQHEDNTRGTVWKKQCERNGTRNGNVRSEEQCERIVGKKKLNSKI
jgi:hypothetical protein